MDRETQRAYMSSVVDLLSHQGAVLSEGNGKKRIGETWEDWEWTGNPGVYIDSHVLYPLHNDADAFRIALMLHIRCAIYPDGYGYAEEEFTGKHYVEFNTRDYADQFEAARHNIVRVAHKKATS